MPSVTSDPDDDSTSTRGRRSSRATRAASAMVSPSARVSAPRWWPETERACTTAAAAEDLDPGADRARDVGAQGDVDPGAGRGPGLGTPAGPTVPGAMLGGRSPLALMVGGRAPAATRSGPTSGPEAAVSRSVSPGRRGGGDACVCDATGPARGRRHRRPPARDRPDPGAHPGLRDLRVRPPLPAPRRDHGVDDRRDAPVHGRAGAWAWHPSTCRATSSWATSSAPRSSSWDPTPPGPAPGARVVSVPVLFSSTGLHQLAYNNDYPGGYAQYMLLSAPLALEVPNGLDSRHAALTEPLAVGHPRRGHARGPRPATVPWWWGAGPSGWPSSPALRAVGVESIVAADLSPTRRAMALTMGAVEAVDPTEEGVVDAWRRLDGRRPLVAFEAVGVPGMLQQTAARRAARAPGWRSSGCAWSRTGSSRSSPSPRSCRCTSPWPTAPTSSPAPCGPWPKATSTCPP